MPPADPTPAPPPEWATDMARDHLSPGGWLHGRTLPDGVKERVYDLARLLASVREGALREAHFAAASAIALPDVAQDVSDAILSLLSTPPVPPQEG